MERLKGFLIILLCNFAGNLFVTLTGLPMPGSVFGLILLLLQLLSKAVKLETVEPSARLLISLLMIFILPGGVKLMTNFDKFTGIVPQLLIVAVLSTLLALLSSAFTAEKLALLLARRAGKDKAL